MKDEDGYYYVDECSRKWCSEEDENDYLETSYELLEDKE